MKKEITIIKEGKISKKQITVIPLRYVMSAILAVLEVLAVISVVIALCIFVPYFYVLAYLTQIVCAIRIIASDYNPDYKTPWLFFVLVLPVIGFMLYFLFYSRKLKKKYIKRLKYLQNKTYEHNDDKLLCKLKVEDETAYSQANLLLNISGAHVYNKNKVKYYDLGEKMFKDLLNDLSHAKNFILMEYFIIAEGEFWNSVLEILTKKAQEGLEIKLIYDDIGCMSTLTGNYYKKLQKLGIESVPFSRLRGSADSEFNNRNHRKITVIDGKIAYTGGINISDEYINKVNRFGHWKDTGVKIYGQGVRELTKLFLTDYGINVKRLASKNNNYYPEVDDIKETDGYVVAFGDGPRPIYDKKVGQSIISRMLESAQKYVYIMTPYLIIDNLLCQTIENTAMRGVDVRIIMPHIPDKKFVFAMSRSYYYRLIKAGVKIYEYTPGFVHAKTYLSDGKYAMVGTINLDFRSLAHHYENGVWMYGVDCIKNIEKDFIKTLKKSEQISVKSNKENVLKRVGVSVAKIFAPLM